MTTTVRSWQLTKIEVAERQLNQAIVLFFEGGDPVSIHTLAEAAAQVLYDIKNRVGAISKLRDSDRIRPEYKREWLAALATSRNFFKHADRDGDATHEFKEEFNHFSIMDGVSMLATAKSQWTPETLVFLAWFTSNYPRAVAKDNNFAGIIHKYRSGLSGNDEHHRSVCARAIRELRTSREMPGVSTSLGLSRDDA